MIRAGWQVLNRRLIGRIAVYAALIVAFFLTCCSNQLLFDFQHERWRQLAEPLAYIIVASLFLAWRLRWLEAFCTGRAIIQSLVCSIFCFILFAPLVSQIHFLSRSIDAVSVSLTGKKDNPDSSRVDIIKQIPTAYEGYVKKNFNLPLWFVQLNALVKVHLFGVSPNNTIALGKEGFYFEGIGASRVEKEIIENYDNIADYMGQIPFTDSELLQWKIALEQRSYWLKQQGSDYVFVLAPTKGFVYPEYLPESLRRVRGHARYEQLAQYLKEYADIHFVDLLPPLLAAKEKTPSPLLFYKTDFHWNFYGAFIAYKAIVGQLAHFFPQYDLRSPELSDFDMKIDNNWAHRRFMYMLGLPIFLHENEQHVTMVPRPGGLYDSARDLPPGGIYDHYPKERAITASDGTSMDIRLLLNPKAPIPSIVLLGDSFMEKCIYFFCANAQRVLNYRTIIDFPKEIFHYEQPTIVIQEILNMFILRPPPKNPIRLGVHYFEEKFKRNPDKVLLLEQQEDLVAKEEGAESQGLPQSVSVRGLTERKQGEIRVGAFSFASATKENITLNLLTKDAEVNASRTCSLQPGLSTCYFDIPSDAVDSIVFVSPGETRSTTFVYAFEVRSDARIP